MRSNRMVDVAAGSPLGRIKTVIKEVAGVTTVFGM
jgi:hypothetical protein